MITTSKSSSALVDPNIRRTANSKEHEKTTDQRPVVFQYVLQEGVGVLEDVAPAHAAINTATLDAECVGGIALAQSIF